MKDPYEDMYELPRHKSAKHPPMPGLERAAQFSPFAALSGHGEAIQETEEILRDKVENEVLHIPAELLE